VGRPRSEHVEGVKAILLGRLADGNCRAGERFLSNRALAAKHHLSYQTADRLIGELCREGFLERRPASGTYVPGQVKTCLGACLCFNARARRADSFGARLLRDLTARLAEEGVKFWVRFCDEPDAPIGDDWYPVLWEWTGRWPSRAGLLLHRRPAPGMDSTYWDSVTVDDHSGGVCAGQVLRQSAPKGGRWVVVSGPADDYSSRARVAGFRSIMRAKVIEGGWFSEDGSRVAPQVIALNPSGIFFANDRLAEGFLRFARETGEPVPPFVGFDDAPIAQELEMTTIAIPWSEFTLAATGTIRLRLGGHRGTGSHQILAPSPVLRH
jgi:DNA-binding transcriptional regulator YhcF (GntR family)